MLHPIVRILKLRALFHPKWILMAQHIIKLPTTMHYAAPLFSPLYSHVTGRTDWHLMLFSPCYFHIHKSTGGLKALKTICFQTMDAKYRCHHQQYKKWFVVISPSLSLKIAPPKLLIRKLPSQCLVRVIHTERVTIHELLHWLQMHSGWLAIMLGVISQTFDQNLVTCN